MAKRVCTKKIINISNLKDESPQFNMNLLPGEVLHNIFSFLCYHELAVKVRLVSKKFKAISENILNKSFLKLENLIEKDLDYTDKIRHDVNDAHNESAWIAHDLMEHICTNYRMTRACIWHYIFTTSTPRICMYGGHLIDEYLKILQLPITQRTMRQVAHVQRLSNGFQDYFENIIERAMNDHYTVSGAKLVDILDCIEDPTDEGYQYVQFEHANILSGKYSLKCTYTLPRTWLCFITSNKWKLLRGRHRLFSHTLRKLVNKHNYYTLNDNHTAQQYATYNRFLLSKKDGIYAGYHKETLTYYGCYSPATFNLYFPILQVQLMGAQEVNEEGINELQVVGEDQPHFQFVQPNMNLEFRVTLKCPIYEAPLRFTSNYIHNFIFCKNSQASMKRDKIENFHYEINISCPSSKDSRLPHYFTWRVA